MTDRTSVAINRIKAKALESADAAAVEPDYHKRCVLEQAAIRYWQLARRMQKAADAAA